MNEAERDEGDRGEGGGDRSRGTDIVPAVTSEEPAAISGGFCAPFKNANCG